MRRPPGANRRHLSIAAREKAADACGCQDVSPPSSSDQRLKEGFGAGREILERGQRRRTVEGIDREDIVVHRWVQLRRRARAVVLDVVAAEVVVDLKSVRAAGKARVLGELGCR